MTIGRSDLNRVDPPSECYLVAESDDEIAAYLKTFGLEGYDASGRVLQARHVPFPAECLRQALDHGRLAMRETADAIGQMFAKRPFSVHQAAENALHGQTGMSLLCRHTPGEILDFETAPRNRRDVLLDCGRWVLGRHEPGEGDPSGGRTGGSRTRPGTT